MKIMLEFVDDKSNKFWRTETLGCDMWTNWGKIGTNGRSELVSFKNSEDCEKYAKKLVDSKIKKGYLEVKGFDETNHKYFDIEEFGTHPLTSHPNFRKYFTDELYYDCGEDRSPFGNDDGYDTLHELQEIVAKSKKFTYSNFPKTMVEGIWNLTYLPPNLSLSDVELVQKASEPIGKLTAERYFIINDRVIFATAFGQIKITGKLEKELYDLAIESFERIERMGRLLWDWAETPKNFILMKNDLINFAGNFGLC